MRIIIGAIVSFFAIKLPLTNVYTEIAFIIASIFISVYIFFEEGEEERKFVFTYLISTLLFILAFILLSDYSFYEIIGFAIITVSTTLKMIKEFKKKKS
jgi:uncharacterized membrane protein AbrB (regulator of aidB expression)